MSWRKIWLLFTVIWVVVAGLNVFTIVAFSEDQREKAWQPLMLLFAVPAILYAFGAAWEWIRKKIGA